MLHAHPPGWEKKTKTFGERYPCENYTSLFCISLENGQRSDTGVLPAVEPGGHYLNGRFQFQGAQGALLPRVVHFELLGSGTMLAFWSWPHKVFFHIRESPPPPEVAVINKDKFQTSLIIPLLHKPSLSQGFFSSPLQNKIPFHPMYTILTEVEVSVWIFVLQKWKTQHW